MTRHLSTYSARAKIGLIVPPTNTVNEAEWSRLMPDGVTFHTHRMKLHGDTTSEAGRAGLLADLDGAFAMLKPARIDVIAYACTAGSMVSPAHSLPDQLSQRSGVKAVTTAASIIEALAFLGVRRLSVATPYHQALNDHEVHFLSENGFEVLSITGLGIGEGGPHEYPRIAETPLDAVGDQAKASFVANSDALLITCTDFPTLPLIERLEAQLGVPVITSNQATLWASLRAAGIADAVEGAGRLLRS